MENHDNQGVLVKWIQRVYQLFIIIIRKPGIFEDWITHVDKKMRRQNRHVLLFLDKAPSHPKLTLNNVTLQFLPANTTSKSQPMMDQGIIHALKLRYRRRQLQKTIMKMDRDKTLNGSDLLKQISVLDAIYWTSNSWNDLDNSTIQKCFKRCGSIQENVENNTDIESDDVLLIVLQMANDLFGISYKNLVEIDSELIALVILTNRLNSKCSGHFV